MLPVEPSGIRSEDGDGPMKDRRSVMGLSAGFLEAYAREPYRERSTSLLQLRAAVEAPCTEMFEQKGHCGIDLFRLRIKRPLLLLIHFLVQSSISGLQNEPTNTATYWP